MNSNSNVSAVSASVLERSTNCDGNETADQTSAGRTLFHLLDREQGPPGTSHASAGPSADRCLDLASLSYDQSAAKQ